jgi:hypothetical protein
MGYAFLCTRDISHATLIARHLLDTEQTQLGLPGILATHFIADIAYEKDEVFMGMPLCDMFGIFWS